MTEAILFEEDTNNIVTLTIDLPGQSANTMNTVYREAIDHAVQKIEKEKKNISGIIITSAKKTFFAGGDLNELYSVKASQSESFFNVVEQLKVPMRRLETLNIPVVAAINGTALGGGFEIALACHYRIAINNPKIKIGLPEVTLGLLPGGGGTVRMVRLLGVESALPFLLEGKQVNPEKALNHGLIHQLASDRNDMLIKAKSWILANRKSEQPWDKKGYKIPGGTPNNPALAQKIAMIPSILKQKTKGCYPAPEKILAAVVEGAQVDFDTASRIESRYFTQLTTSQVAKNMIGTLWFQLNELKAGGSRPDNIDHYKTKKVGILGAGMMGAGIAFSTAIKGIKVVLKDVNLEAAEKGKNYSEKILSKWVSKNRITSSKKEEILKNITTTAFANDLSGCDLVIEAVFENRELKAKVTKEAEQFIDSHCTFSSNTSTLPISGLASAYGDESKFIGLHFFSPVDKMPLVEIIKGENTSDETLARAFDYVMQINKTPIVVNDSRGFFTSRTFSTYVNEGLRMVSEGIKPQLIENAALQGGMPVGPLAVQDEVSLALTKKVTDQTRKDLESKGEFLQETPAEILTNQMINEFKREGKSSGAGFYNYPKNGKKHLWKELTTHYFKPEVDVSITDIQERLLFIQSIETLKCYEEKVLTSVRDANIGSIFGLGFAPWTGGAIQYVNQYGIRKFYKRAVDLSKAYGERFTPPLILELQAELNEEFK